MDNIFGEVISTYTRAQAIKDGMLVDASKMAHEAGIKFPVAITSALWNGYITPDPRAEKFGQSIEGRLWDTLWMLYNAIRSSRGGSTIHFSLYYIMKTKQRRLIQLKALCHGGDHGEPVITLMLPDED